MGRVDWPSFLNLRPIALPSVKDQTALRLGKILTFCLTGEDRKAIRDQFLTQARHRAHVDEPTKSRLGPVIRSGRNQVWLLGNGSHRLPTRVDCRQESWTAPVVHPVLHDTTGKSVSTHDFLGDS